MLKDKLCLVAEGIIRDADNNLISTYNIFEELIVQGFPLFIQKIGFLAIWEKDNDDSDIHQTTFRVDLNGSQLMSQNIEINFAGKTRNRSVVAINGLVLTQPGTLKFSMEIENGPVASYSILLTPIESRIEANTSASPNTQVAQP